MIMVFCQLWAGWTFPSTQLQSRAHVLVGV
jgi:hypothetical protein